MHRTRTLTLAGSPPGQRGRRLGPLGLLVALCLLLGGTASEAASPQPAGEMRWALYVTFPPAWLDPAEVAIAGVSPFWLLYAVHDALVKPMPGNPMAPSLAESWTVSADFRVYDFHLRQGLTFHNGDPFTAEDVRFSFLRYKWPKSQQEKVQEVEIVDPYRVRIHLHEPWPDFMTYYGTLATGAAWIVPKRYVERVGDDGFRQHPIGLGPYKFVRQTPGIEVVMEAFEGYWRKVPHVKRLVFKSIPDAATRMAMLKKGEVDVAYLLTVPLAEEARRDPKLRVAFSGGIGVAWLHFLEQWDPQSPWHDHRVRLAANYAIDRQTLSEAETLGASKPTGSLAPQHFEFTLPIEPYPYDPALAKRLLAEAGYPHGFDGGDLTPVPPYFDMGEAIVNYFRAVGIRMTLRTMERAAFFAAWNAKQLRGVCLCGSGRYGNAASRLEEVVLSTGTLAYGGYPDIDALFAQQDVELDREKRTARVEHRATFTRVSGGSITMADYIYLVQMDIPAHLEDEFNRIYDTEHVPHIVQVPGVHGCTRYRLESTNAQGMARYAAVYDIDSPDVPSSAGWRAASEKGAWPTTIRPHTTNRSHSIFKRLT